MDKLNVSYVYYAEAFAEALKARIEHLEGTIELLQAGAALTEDNFTQKYNEQQGTIERLQAELEKTNSALKIVEASARRRKAELAAIKNGDVVVVSEEELKEFATKFFFYWWNKQGSNTMDAFDEWYEKAGKAMIAAQEE